MATAQATKAVCVLNGAGVAGTVVFTQAADGPTTVTIKATGFTPGQHGFHVHAYGDLTNGCASTGPHFNPFNQTHGAPTADVRHVGDLGNVVAGDDGAIDTTFEDNVIQLSGDNSIVGRAIVVHAGVDDLGLGGHADSLTTGNAGARAACGVIGKAVTV